MKKTGLYTALVCAIPLGVLAIFSGYFWTCVLIGGLIGLAAAFYDMRATR